MHRRLGVLDDTPRLRKIEHDSIEAGRVDALVRVAHLDGVVRAVAEERADVRLGPRREVVADLVPDDRRTSPQQRHRQRA